MLPESKKCKKVTAWRGDFGTDQYVSWCLPTEDLCLDAIWAKYEDLCKPQVNEVRALLHRLTSFRQGDRSVDEKIQCCTIHKCLFPSTHQKLQVSYIEIYSDSS